LRGNETNVREARHAARRRKTAFLKTVHLAKNTAPKKSFGESR
jgi:hypothetical protein